MAFPYSIVRPSAYRPFPPHPIPHLAGPSGAIGSLGRTDMPLWRHRDSSFIRLFPLGLTSHPLKLPIPSENNFRNTAHISTNKQEIGNLIKNETIRHRKLKIE